MSRRIFFKKNKNIKNRIDPKVLNGSVYMYINIYIKKKKDL